MDSSGIFISSSQGGILAAGNPEPTGITGANKGVFIQGQNPSDNKAKFLVGDAAGNRITFDGDSIFMSSSGFFLGGNDQFVSGSGGNIEISSSAFHVSGGSVIMSGSITAGQGTVGGWTIASDKLSSGTDADFVGLIAGTGIQIGDSTFADAEFTVNTAGAVTASNINLTGDLTANNITANTAGTIGGWSIGSTSLTGGNATISSSGNLTLGTSNNVVRLSANDSTYRIWTGHATAGSAPFRVHKDGTLTATGATITGNISITSGDLAGIDADTISGSGNATSASLSASNAQTLIDSASIAATVQLTNTGMNILNSDSNAIAQYSSTATIGRTSGTNNNVFIDSDSVDIRKGFQTSASFGTTTLIGPTGSRHIKITGAAFEIKTDATTTVLSASAAGLETRGKIRATSGDIGGFGISATTVSSSNDKLILKSSGQITASAVSMSGTVVASGGEIGGFIIDSSEVRDSGNKLRLKASGQITASAMSMSGAVTATSGEIGGFKIATDLDSISGTLKLKGASGQITASAMSMSGTVTADSGRIAGFNLKQTAQESTFFDDNKRLILSGSSGEITSSKVLFTGGKIGGWDIGASTIDSTLNSFRLDAASDGGTMRIGASFGPNGPTSTTRGIYMAGTGDFAFVQDANNRMFYDTSGDFKLLAQSWYIGTAGGAYISGSGGNLEMSASNFMLGNATTYMSGSPAGISISGSAVDIYTNKFFFGSLFSLRQDSISF